MFSEINILNYISSERKTKRKRKKFNSIEIDLMWLPICIDYFLSPALWSDFKCKKVIKRGFFLINIFSEISFQVNFSFKCLFFLSLCTFSFFLSITVRFHFFPFFYLFIKHEIFLSFFVLCLWRKMATTTIVSTQVLLFFL